LLAGTNHNRLDGQMTSRIFAILGSGLFMATLATVAWGVRYRRMPFHPKRGVLTLRVLAIAECPLAAVVGLALLRTEPQPGLSVIVLGPMFPALFQTSLDFGSWLGPGRAGRYQQGKQVECGLRVVEGTQPGLGTRFRHGLATLEPGGIGFVAFVGGVRLLRRQPVQVAVMGVDRSHQRSIRGMEGLSARPGLRVIKVLTRVATLEWVLSPQQTDWAAEKVRLQ
jgi:hypothetical protein